MTRRLKMSQYFEENDDTQLCRNNSTIENEREGEYCETSNIEGD